MSLPVEKTEYINGSEPILSPEQQAAKELREANIFNFNISELQNGSKIITIEGTIEPQTVGILNRNGFRLRGSVP